jgi:manganese transport protein
MTGAGAWLMSWLARLPQTSTEPFCPTEIRATVPVPAGASWWARFRRYAGIGFLISVGYVDPGNWATDIAAGSRFGFDLLWVVLLSSPTAMLLQTLCVRLGVATGKDIAQLCRERFSPVVNRLLWAFAQIAIVACDFAEVLGTALALKLLTGLPLAFGIALTAFDTLVVLFLQGRGILNIETIVAALLGVVAACFAIEIVYCAPDWTAAANGLRPSLGALNQPGALMIAIGILGATVMPHNLYLH